MWKNQLNLWVQAEISLNAVLAILEAGLAEGYQGLSDTY